MKKVLHIIRLLGIAFIATILVSCASTEKMLHEGRYEELVRLAKKKLAGKKKKKTKYVVALEKAFNQIQVRDLRKIEALKLTGTLNAWEKVYDLSYKIEHRQEALRPYLPVTDELGYKATFNFIKTAPIINESRGKAAMLLYNRALDLMALARTGDKKSARKAYYVLGDIDKYYNTYKEKAALMNEAEALGKVKVWLDVENHSDDYIPAYFEKEILALNFSTLNERWTEYYVHPEEEIELDYRAKLEIRHIHVSPEAIHEDEIVKEKEIKDGWQYVLDENGNVLKDSLGNDVKEDRWIKVKGSVLLTTQKKVSTIEARLNLIDLKNRVVVESRPVQANAVFEHVAQRFFGDKRALARKDRRIISPVPFPTDLQMIMKASDVLKPTFLKEIQACRLI